VLTLKTDGLMAVTQTDKAHGTLWEKHSTEVNLH
jgi:hypothetical protein